MSNMAEKSIPLDLKDACVTAAHAVIAEHGVEKLSLRDVARKLNVSHQAPYKHYASRDHLLAEVIRRCFVRFSDALNARVRSIDTMQDMRALCISYMDFALHNPLEYRLMFGTPWPEAAAQPEMLADARYSFDVLRGALKPLYEPLYEPLYKDLDAQRQGIDTAAMYVWSTLHGLASIMQSQAMCGLELHPKYQENAVEQVMDLVTAGLEASTQKVNLSV
jgi:AcrR family transcriptional regulator